MVRLATEDAAESGDGGGWNSWADKPPPSSPLSTARSPVQPVVVAPGSPASVMRFDGKISLDKGPALPPSHFQRGPATAMMATDALSNSSSSSSNSNNTNNMVYLSSPPSAYPEHLCLAMDCEMVGVGPHHVSVLARVSIVNFRGEIVYDTFVKVEEKVTDYRTAVSGIRPEDLRNGVPYGKCRAQVRILLAGKVLVGHGLQNDLAVLNLRHPAHMIRDTSLYLPYSMQDFGSGIVVRSRSLRDLMRDFCGQTIQAGEHDSVQDARAAMTLYGLVKTEWDATTCLSSSSSYASTATATTTNTAATASLSYHHHHHHHIRSFSSSNVSYSSSSSSSSLSSSSHHRSTNGRKSFVRPTAASSSSAAAATYDHHHHYEYQQGYPLSSYYRSATTFY